MGNLELGSDERCLRHKKQPRRCVGTGKKEAGGSGEALVF